jgi:hypothetical protein
MEFIWIRVDERFKHMHAAFRFLDVNYNNSISFAELTQGLESLKVKMSVDDQFEVFKHLDKGNKGHLNYHDFCNLSDERRRGIDPAQHMMKQYEQVGGAEGQAIINAGNKARSPSQKEKYRLK